MWKVYWVIHMNWSVNSTQLLIYLLYCKYSLGNVGIWDGHGMNRFRQGLNARLWGNIQLLIKILNLNLNHAFLSIEHYDNAWLIYTNTWFSGSWWKGLNTPKNSVHILTFFTAYKWCRSKCTYPCLCCRCWGGTHESWEHHLVTQFYRHGPGGEDGHAPIGS